jgi:dCMP deaminase
MDNGIKILKENPVGSRPDWDEEFMSIAIKNSNRSSCWFVRSGSLITYKNQIVASGYNGASSKYDKNCLDAGCAKEKKGLEYETSLGSGYCIGMHSEMNAVGHLNKINSDKLTLYTTIFPCPSCAKNLQPYGIERLVFKKNYSEEESKIALMHLKGIEVNQLDLSLKRHWETDAYMKWKKFDVWTEEEFEKAQRIFKNWEKL